VLDTNAVLDCWAFDDPPARPLRRAAEGGLVTLLRSPECDAELGDVLARPRFAALVDRDAMLARWRALAIVVERGAPAPWRCADPDDQKFLDLACAGGASLLATKDRALLRLARSTRDRLLIATPAAAASLLGLQDRLA